ncbi:MAG: sn-glycerol-3-phosphate ABC transporter ATP-binding protein UgpC [Gammaproteobacteria bacterium]|nr:sn-glycerol-3-phosphate ABC transporter ATP-binding protein UgpC [Gammaproteobacteria bacterium]
MSGVKLSQLVKRYGDIEVVKAIDLEVHPHEFIVLVGPSGCGKSTTLRMIAGLEEISAGTVSIKDQVVNRVAPKDRDVAMVFQNYALYPHLNVAENIAFGLRIRKTPKAEITTQVSEVAEILGLTEYLKRRPADLSGGQRQRVAMGRAIVRHPEVFLFDEPLSNLDAKLRSQMRAEIKRLHKRLDATSIYVTHDQVEAMTLADRIVVMNDGIIEQIGTPMELFRHPANTFVAGFIGSPPMNQFEATLSGSAQQPIAEIADQAIALPAIPELAERIGSRVTVGIRPEHAHVHNLSANPVAVQLELVETLGSEALLHTTLAQEPFIIKTETEGYFDMLEEVSAFSVDPAQIKVFDIDSGRVLGQTGN